MKLSLKFFVAGVAALLVASPSMAMDLDSETSATVTQVDFKGRPPFKRRIETLSVEDVASLESLPNNQAGKMVTVTSVDFRGRPPFRRHTETLVVEDLASFETNVLGNSGLNPTKFRGRPPYRR